MNLGIRMSPDNNPGTFREEDNDAMGDRQAANEEQLSELQKYRSQTMKDYGLMIEYKHMKQHVPSGIYVLPNFDEPRLWHGVIFIHQGLYRHGIFKFSIRIPESYNGIGTYPKVTFFTKVFHPFVYPESNELDLLPKFPTWDPDLHYIVSVLVYMKSIFYTKEFSSDLRRVANNKALDMFRRHPEAYVEQVDACVERSLENTYQNEPGSSLRFTKPIPAHEKLRQDFLQKFGGQDNDIANLNDTIMDTMDPMETRPRTAGSNAATEIEDESMA